ncbi:MAG: hypothetical protein V2A78_02910 [bacterium]
MKQAVISAISPQAAFLCASACLALGGTALLFLGKKRSISAFISMLSHLASLIFIIYAAVFVKDLGILPARPLFSLTPLKASFLLRLDGTAVFFLLLFSLLGVVVTWFSREFGRGFSDDVFRRYYPSIHLLLISLFFCVSLRDMLFFLLFWETATLASCLLLFPSFPKTSVFSRRFLLIEHAALILILAPLLSLALFSGGWSFELIQGAMGKIAVRMPVVLFLLLTFFLIGFGARAGTLSIFRLEQEKELSCSPPVLALIFCGLSPLGLYGLLRVFPGMLLFLRPAYFWGWALAFLGLFFLIGGCLKALKEPGGEGLLAFLCRAQVGLILVGLGTAVSFLRIDPAVSALSLASAFLLLFVHVLSAAILFLSMNSASSPTGSSRGASEVILLSTALLSAAGLPLFGGFAGRWLLLQAGFFGGIELTLCLGLGLGTLFAAVLVPACLLKLVSFLVFRQAEPDSRPKACGAMDLSRAVLALLCLALFLFPVLTLKLVSLGMSGLFPSGYLPPFGSLFGNSPWQITLTGGGEWSPLLIGILWIILTGLACSLYRMGDGVCLKAPLWRGQDK